MLFSAVGLLLLLLFHGELKGFIEVQSVRRQAHCCKLETNYTGSAQKLAANVCALSHIGLVQETKKKKEHDTEKLYFRFIAAELKFSLSSFS